LVAAASELEPMPERRVQVGAEAAGENDRLAAECTGREDTQAQTTARKGRRVVTVSAS
jgi:hypothetical protein